MCCFTVKSFVKALKYGSKYVYRTLPRLLTLWLDVGEEVKLSATSDFSKMNEAVSEAIKSIPAFKVKYI
jgi:serine/threonine-protein kinase ATR